MTIFYKKNIQTDPNQLPEEESKHCTQVLRRQVGDEIMIFDGNGGKYKAVLTKISKKACEFEVNETEIVKRKAFYTHLAIAPTKSTDRIEWMIEKLCEMGIDEVTFIETHHSERRKLRIDRLERKSISAMKQSGNPYLMKVNELTPFNELVKNKSAEKYIAHVDSTHSYLADIVEPSKTCLLLIGPEGDFSNEELALAKANNFKPVSLGENTLRTETAGMIACNMVNIINKA